MTGFGVLPCKFWCQNENRGLQMAELNMLVQLQWTDSSQLPDLTDLGQFILTCSLAARMKCGRTVGLPPFPV